MKEHEGCDTLSEDMLSLIAGGELVSNWQERCLSYMARERSRHPDLTIEEFFERGKLILPFLMMESGSRDTNQCMNMIRAFVRQNWNNTAALSSAIPLRQVIK